MVIIENNVPKVINLKANTEPFIEIKERGLI
jgi:hypothetical protein